MKVMIEARDAPITRAHISLERFRNSDGDMVALAQLTEREVFIFTKVIEGYTSQQIADEYFISKHTVDTHRRNITRKTGYRGYMQWLVAALELGLLQNTH